MNIQYHPLNQNQQPRLFFSSWKFISFFFSLNSYFHSHRISSGIKHFMHENILLIIRPWIQNKCAHEEELKYVFNIL